MYNVFTNVIKNLKFISVLGLTQNTEIAIKVKTVLLINLRSLIDTTN